MTREEIQADVTERLERLKAKGEVAAYYWTDGERKPTVRLIVIGERVSDEVNKLRQDDDIDTEVMRESEIYHFLGGELRPGTGIIRREGGRPEGPSGTLTCFLSSRDSQDLYFAAAGHVITNFWKVDPPDVDGSIYLNRKGYPATNSMRFLGNVAHRSAPPNRVDLKDNPKEASKDLDIAIVRIEGKFDLRQRTTCFGHFGEWLSEPEDVMVEEGKPRPVVMKCGAEETHWTAAEVEKTKACVWIYGPDKAIYRLENQVILRRLPEDPLIERCKYSADQSSESSTQQSRLDARKGKPKDIPKNRPQTPFAVAGDSGAMVVDSSSKKPVGMLIAGSILEGRYVMTPITAISKYWEGKTLVLLRA